MNEEEIDGLENEIYIDEGNICPYCFGAMIEEETYGFEKVSFCSHCEYASTRNIVE